MLCTYFGTLDNFWAKQYYFENEKKCFGRLDLDRNCKSETAM